MCTRRDEEYRLELEFGGNNLTDRELYSEAVCKFRVQPQARENGTDKAGKGWCRCRHFYGQYLR